ncbi:hypothetical protein MMC18_005035 [Xylographa bjoerkii]|nr:hypothetical protein [Xylographa bjoerkii]
MATSMTDIQLDGAVIAELPEGSTVLQVSNHGISTWTRTARMSVRLIDGTIKSFFLKCASEDNGRAMLLGEFHSMSQIHSVMPSFASKPYACGKLRNCSQDTYFLLLDFISLGDDLVDPTAFCARLAELHLTSQSPTWMFGFSITTYHGPNEQNVEWHSDWCFYFTGLLKQFFDREVVSSGSWPAYEQLFEQLILHAVPQILEPLQFAGRRLKPSLMHGDLWEGNTGTNLVSGEPVVFDAAAMYAHNEFELGMWRRDIVRFGRTYIEQYFGNYPPSEPVEQWDDRNRLYSVKFNLAHGIALPETKEEVREL